MEILLMDKQETSWMKLVIFSHEGQEYTALLSWDSYDGYDLRFQDKQGNEIPAPSWANEWDDSHQYGAESLEYTLDSLTDEVSA